MYKLPNVCLPFGCELETLLFGSRNEFHANGCTGMFLINIQFGPQNALWLIEIEIAASQHTIPINALSSRLAEKEKPAINVKRIY